MKVKTQALDWSLLITFPWFTLRLIGLNLAFFLKFFVFKKAHLRVWLISSLFLFTTLLFSFNAWFLHQQLAQQPPPPTTGIEQLNLTLIKTELQTLSPEEIKLKIENLTKLSQELPPQRDLYLNLAILNQATGQAELAKQYLNQAQQLDPNHQVFP